MVSLSKKIVGLSLVAVFFLLSSTGLAYGKGFTIVGNKSGLEIRVPEKTQDTGNLNPGDKMHSYLSLVNTGSHTITVYIRTNIISERPRFGGRLAKVMTLTIKDDGKVITNGTFKRVAKKGNIRIGKIPPKGEKTICFFTDLPETLGNCFQGSSFKANWTFTTEVTGGISHGDDKGGKDKDKPKQPDLEEEDPPGDIILEDDPTPGGVPDPPPFKVPDEPAILEIPGGDIPAGVPDMPATGESHRYPLYALGVGLISAGVRLRCKKK